MFGLGTQELLVILVIVLVLFGANRLPQLARSLGSSLKESGAAITVESRQGAGTTFRLTMPAIGADVLARSSAS